MLHDNDSIRTVQVGFVVALLVAAVGVVAYEQVVVDNQRRTTELTHNRQVEAQLQQLHSSIHTVASGNRKAPASVSVALGTGYASGTPLSSSQQASGRLRTVGIGNDSATARLRNVALRSEEGDFLNGTTSYPTGLLVYDPAYNYYTDAPRTLYEHGVLYNEWQSAKSPGRRTRTPGPLGDVDSTVLAQQPLVSGRTISLVTLGGSVRAESTGSTRLTVAPQSVSTQTVRLRNETGKPITLSLPTRLSGARWRWLLRNETRSYGGHVSGIEMERLPSEPYDRVHVSLEPGPAYELHVARVRFGESATRPPARYIVPVEGTNASVGEGRTRRVTVEVRDRFNNPVSDVRVAAAGNVSRRVVRAGPKGGATFVYHAPGDIDGRAERVQLNVSIVANPAVADRFDATTPTNATVDLWVHNTDGSTDGPGDSSVFDLNLETPSFLGSCAPRCVWNLSETRPGPNHEFDLGAVVDAEQRDGLGVEFATNDSSLVTLFQKPSERLRGGDRATTRVVANGSGVVGLRASAGGETDTVTVALRNATDRIASPALAVVSGSGTARARGGVASRGQFVVENTSPNRLRLDELVFANVTDDAVAGIQIWNFSDGKWADEVYLDAETDIGGLSPDGNINAYSMWRVGSSARFTDTPVLDPGDRATVYISEFVDADHTPVDVRGETVTLGVRYETPTLWRGSETLEVTFD